MGAWATGNFGNDDALDFVGGLQGEGPPFVELMLIAVEMAGDDEEPEAPDCASALAAAEIVAAALGRPPDDFPEEAAGWLRAQSTRKRAELIALRERALRAVERIESRSELRELWAEVPDFAEWRRVIAGLRARLQQAAAPR